MLQVALLPPYRWRGHGDATVSLEQREARRSLVDQMAKGWLAEAVQRSAQVNGYIDCPDPVVELRKHAHDGERRLIQELRVEVNFTRNPVPQPVNAFLWAFLDDLTERFGLQLPLYEGHGLGLVPLRIACDGATFGRISKPTYINMTTGCVRKQPTVQG